MLRGEIRGRERGERGALQPAPSMANTCHRHPCRAYLSYAKCISVSAPYPGPGPLRQRLWVRLKGFLDFRNRPCQLRIAALDQIGRIVFNLDVGVDPMAFDHILAFRIGRSEFRHVHLATIQKRPSARDSHHPAPGAFPDQRPQTRLAKHLREDIAIGCRSLIDHGIGRVQVWATGPTDDQRREEPGNRLCIPEQISGGGESFSRGAGDAAESVGFRCPRRPRGHRQPGFDTPLGKKICGRGKALSRGLRTIYQNAAIDHRSIGNICSRVERPPSCQARRRRREIDRNGILHTHGPRRLPRRSRSYHQSCGCECRP